MIAICTIRQEPQYRRDAFDRGLKAAGYTIVDRGAPKSKRDLLVIWNRHAAQQALANTWESQGGTVLVCENGYLGADSEGRKLYAISVHGHNGSGWFPVGDEDRFKALGVAVHPWRVEGRHVLICGQRGIGSQEMASPPRWHDKAADQVRRISKRRVLVRQHPGTVKPKTTLDEDLAGAHACLVWSSASAVRALTLGVPVFYKAPKWICAGAALRDLDRLETPLMDDEARRVALHRMAWGQHTAAEIESGAPFVRIIEQIGSAKW